MKDARAELMLTMFIWFNILHVGRCVVIPRNLSEGLIFCCGEDANVVRVEDKMGNLIQLSEAPPTIEPHLQLSEAPPTIEPHLQLSEAPPISEALIQLSGIQSTTTERSEDQIVGEDYHGLRSFISIVKRRRSQLQCLRLTQPMGECYWIHTRGIRTTMCFSFLHSGKEARPGEYPFMAAVGFRSDNETQWVCGGSLISHNFVLTAAHCAFSRSTGEPPSVVRLGAHNFVDPGDSFNDVAVASATVHPNYTLARKYNDIALLQLEELVWFTNRIKPACLWHFDDLDLRERPTVLGWGRTGYNKNRSDVLLKGFLDIIPQQNCQTLVQPTKKFPRLIDEQMCALDMNETLENMVDTCQGDSGGPLFTVSNRDAFYDIPYVIGITSFGKTCADGYPGIYTRISSYVPWIESIVWPEHNRSWSTWDTPWFLSSL